MILFQVQPAAKATAASHFNYAVITTYFAETALFTALRPYLQASAANLTEMIPVSGILHAHAAVVALVKSATIRTKTAVFTGILSCLNHTFSAIIANDAMFRAMHSFIRALLPFLKALIALFTVQATFLGAI